MNWLKDTTQDYRRGFVEGEAGVEDVYLLKDGMKGDLSEYYRGFEDGKMAVKDRDRPAAF